MYAIRSYYVELKDGKNLLIHLRMSGRLHLVARDLPREKHEHVILNFIDGNQLRFHDTRKFGRIVITSYSIHYTKLYDAETP